MEQCVKKIFFRIFLLISGFPLLMIIFNNFSGYDLHDAALNSLEALITLPEALFSWSIILFIGIVIINFMRPVFDFWKRYNHQDDIPMALRNRSMTILNSMEIIVVAANVMAFLIAGDIYISSGSDTIAVITNIYHLVESVITGIFSGYLINMSLTNVLFPVKSAIMEETPDIQPKFKSFYAQFALTLILLLVFMVFQFLSIVSEFYLVALDRAGEIFSMEELFSTEIKAEEIFSRIRAGHNRTDALMDILVVKLGFYIILCFYLLKTVKSTIKNPLETVKCGLEQLTENQSGKQKKIDIVNNDEFSQIYKDINKLIQNQQDKLKHSEDRIENILEHAADPIMSFNEEGEILVFNPAAEKLFGWSFREIQDVDFASLFDQGNDYCKLDGGSVRKFIELISENKLQRFTGETKNGEKFTIECNFSISESIDGKTFTAIIRDISKQLEFEESLTKAKVAAERANELKSEFLANMSHELRTPLNAVLGFAQLLHTDKNLTDNQLEKLNIISRSGEHLLGLINDILDISKIEAGRIELHEASFNLRDFAEDIKQMMSQNCKKKGLSLYVEYMDPLPEMIKADLGKLRQIMINIVGNAVKFTKEGGISIVVGEDNGKLRFKINDTGKGIPEDEIKSILQPFTQSSITDNEGGTGLGLAITNSFINMMGGTLEIESEENVGSTFSFVIDFELSNESETAEEIDNRGTVLGIKGDRHPKVIIVDDKINNRLILKEMLERVGFVTIEAENGAEAVERTREFNPEIVLMDIKMPVMDGYEAVKELKADDKTKNIPVFALTASAFKHNVKSILDAGFNGFLAKPFKMTNLFNLIDDNTDVDFIYEVQKEVKKDISIEDLDFNTIAGELSAEQLEQIDDMALINDFAGIKNLLEPLKYNDKLDDFIDSVYYLTDNFDDDNLMKLIEKIKDNL